jgi:hypothetical protein
MVRIKQILDFEKIEYTDSELEIFKTDVMPKFMPDIRMIVSVLQDCCTTGKLVTSTELQLLEGMDNTCKYVFSKLKSGANPKDIRKYLIQNSEEFNEDYTKLSSHMFDMLCNTKISPDALSKVAGIIYRLDQVIDKEIQFFVLINYISSLLSK